MMMVAASLLFLLPFADAGSMVKKGSFLTKPALQLSDDAESGRLRMDFPFYHTSEELSSETARLSKECKGATMSVKTVQRGDISIDDIRVRKGGPKVNRVSFIFGEHSRELISPETGLMLLKMLCGDVSSQKSLVAKALEDSEFQVMLNTNPKSRRKVEMEGDYCLRENPSGVDLNRNWDEKWDLSTFGAGSDQFHGPHPFSEHETQAARDIVVDFKPTTFLSVHSGTLGLYMPWAYDSLHMAERNRKAMLSVLKELDANYCKCPFGAAGKEVGYDCPGTSFDWVYDHLSAPFSFAWEIYADPGDGSSLRQRWEEKLAEGRVSLLQQGHSLEHEAFSGLYNGQSDFVHRSNRTEQLLKEERARFACFGTFNPGTKSEYDEVVQNWATSYLQLATLTAPHVRRLSEKAEEQ